MKSFNISVIPDQTRLGVFTPEHHGTMGWPSKAHRNFQSLRRIRRRTVARKHISQYRKPNTGQHESWALTAILPYGKGW